MLALPEISKTGEEVETCQVPRAPCAGGPLPRSIVRSCPGGSSAASVIASTPALIDGSGAIRNSGQRCSARWPDASCPGGVPPTPEYTPGGGGSMPARPGKSSACMSICCLGVTAASPMPARMAARTHCASAASLTVVGAPSSATATCGSMSSDTPAARAVPSATRSIPFSNCARVSSVLVRNVPCRRAWPEITFGAVPALNAPTVISAGSIGGSSRVTLLCSASTIRLPITTGSVQPWRISSSGKRVQRRSPIAPPHLL